MLFSSDEAVYHRTILDPSYGIGVGVFVDLDGRVGVFAGVLVTVGV